jgi:hypothetical protein
MLTHLARAAALVAAIPLLAACVTPGEKVAVSIDTKEVVGRAAEAPRRARVEVTDIRKSAEMERTALGVSLGPIDLRPPVPELVRAIVQAKADEVVSRQGIADPPVVLVGIRVFDIATPSTPLYWDINAKIEIVLRARGQDRTVTAAATDRTFVWPSEELISKVTTEALKSLAADTERALTALMAAR